MSTVRMIVRGVRGSVVTRWAAHIGEIVIFGTKAREFLAIGLLKGYYSSLWRRHWVWQAGGEPHFTLHKLGLFQLMTGAQSESLSAYSRAFYSSGCVRAGDQVLDVGCGDGTLTCLSLAPRAAHVDAVDIEPSAILYAKRHNARTNVDYSRLNAVTDVLPRSDYDLVAFDGAIAHFSPEVSAELLRKIKSVMKPDGIFTGSESVGPDADDHLQIFDSLEDMRKLLAPHWKHVRLMQSAYVLPVTGATRIEGYWRASDSSERLDEISWYGG
jgi:2-polyprenyl-3-methyl-5-hydroxy-6-metoxy-1,4-benzoquinol methylase